jgi:hypothetical protein
MTTTAAADPVDALVIFGATGDLASWRPSRHWSDWSTEASFTCR